MSAPERSGSKFEVCSLVQRGDVQIGLSVRRSGHSFVNNANSTNAMRTLAAISATSPIVSFGGDAGASV
jgi:hypothetical protein